MSKKPAPLQRPVVSRFHPLIYMAIAGFGLWFVLAAWGFAGNSYIGYLLAIISGFFLLATGLPWVMSRTRSKRQGRADDKPTASLRSWSSGEFETWTGRVRGKFAMIEALLPLAAVAVGMTAFVIVLHIVVHGP
jgi:hypothetical protein